MASVYNSAHNESHIRHLLQQRTAPSNNHSLFQSLSDFPDSPSVYSRSQFTPRPSEPSQRFDEHLASNRDQLHPDTVDFDHDPRSSYASSSIYDRSSYVGDYCTEEDDEPEHRMSMLGIKMRFHSKAPWETGEDDIVEEDEPDTASVYRPPSRSKRSLKNFGGAPRPSGESSRSGSTGKKSFETTSSQLSSRGALQALAQASMSTSSLSPTPPPAQNALRQKLSLPRLRTRTISNSTNSAAISFPHTSESPRSAVFPGSQTSPTSRNKPASPTESEYTQASEARSIFCRSPSPSGHPYANPELVRSYNQISGNRRFDTHVEEAHAINSSESFATLTSSIPATSSNHRRAPSTAPSSPVSIHDLARTKGISAPMPLVAPALQPRNTNAVDNKWRQTKIFPSSTGSGIIGWQEPQPSAFTLISLEEARAQRNLTIDTIPNPQDNVSLVTPRVRSTSTGGKARNAGESSRLNVSSGRSEPTTPEGSAQGKSLKHKKSGFMRMFAKEKDRAPMPLLPLPTSFPDVIPPVPRTPKVSTHRVPVPPLSPTKYETEHDGSADSHEEGTIGAHEPVNASSPKRLMPSLSINTSGSAKRLFGGASSPSHLDLRPPTAPFATSQASQDQQPHSAPPGTTDFVGLKLRPVSTMFSSHFANHILEPESAVSESSSRPTLDMDMETPTTTTFSESVSPISLDFSSRAIHRSRSEKFSVSSSDENQADVIRALQDQISTAQQAWQRHIWQLEGQVRDLKSEIEEIRHAENSSEYCSVCGRGHRTSIAQRPRALTGRSSRFVDS